MAFLCNQTCTEYALLFHQCVVKMWDAFSMTEYSLMSVLSLNVSCMSNETLKELKFFLQVTFDTVLVP